jgi:Ca2+-binding EF-hand superfamily protein
MPNEPVSQEEIEQAFKEIDLNNDGVLTFDEFWMFYESVNQQASRV